MNTGRLAGKIALITGAGSVGPGWGNGRASAIRFAEEGALVYVADFDADRLEETLKFAGPLRERMEDLEMLSGRFLAEAAEELGLGHLQTMHPDAFVRLRRHPFRGNIRELRHVLKGAALRAAGGTILASHLDLDRPELRASAVGVDMVADAGTAGLTWKERLEAQEKQALQRTMEAAGGNLTKAAEMFGVPRTTYREKLVRHGLLTD